MIAADLELSGAAAPVGQDIPAGPGTQGRAVERLRRTERPEDRAEGQGQPFRLRRVTAQHRRLQQRFARSAPSSWAAATNARSARSETINDKRIPTIALAASGAIAAPVAERRYVFKLGPNAAGQRRRARPPNCAATTSARWACSSATTTTAGRARPRSRASWTRPASRCREQRVKTTDTDVSQAGPAARSGKPDALVFWTPPEQATLAATSAQQTALPGPLFFDAARGRRPLPRRGGQGAPRRPR